MRARCRRNAAMAASRGIGDCSEARAAIAIDNCAAAASGDLGIATGFSMKWASFDKVSSMVVSGRGRQEGSQPVECIKRLPRCQPVRVNFSERATQFIVRQRFFPLLIWGRGGGEQGQSAQYSAN